MEKGRAAATAATAAAAAAVAGGGGSSSDSGLLRRLLEDALSTLDRVRAAFGRYRTAAGARIAELSFALHALGPSTCFYSPNWGGRRVAMAQGTSPACGMDRPHRNSRGRAGGGVRNTGPAVA